MSASVKDGAVLTVLFSSSSKTCYHVGQRSYFGLKSVKNL